MKNTRHVTIMIVTMLVLLLSPYQLLAEGKKDAEEITLRWALVTRQPQEEEFVRSIVEMYQKEHPNVKVDIEVYNSEEYNQKLITQLAGGDIPDIMKNWGGNVAALAAAGLTLDLGPYLRSGDFAITDKDIHPVMLDVVTIQSGEIMFIPKEASGYCYYYNKDMFDEAGLDYPTNDWTYDDMVEMAKTLTKKTEGAMQYGFVAHPHLLYPFLAAGGAFGFDGANLDENNEYNFNTPEAVKGIGYLFNGWKEGYAMPISTIDEFGGDINAFALGKAAILPAARWATPKIRGTADFDWDVVLSPVGTTGKHAAFCGTAGYSISVTSEHPEEALGLLFTMFTEEGFTRAAESYAVVPPVTSLFDSDVWRGLPGPPYSNDVFVDLLDDAYTTPMIPQFRQSWVNTALQDAVDNFMGGMSLQEALDIAVDEVNAQIKELVEEYAE